MNGFQFDPWDELARSLGGGLGALAGAGAAYGIKRSKEKQAQKRAQEEQDLISKLRGVTAEEASLYPYLSQTGQSKFIQEAMQRPAKEAYGQLAQQLLGGGQQQIPQQQVAPGQAQDMGVMQTQSQQPLLSGRELNDLIKIQQKQRQLQMQEERPERKFQAEDVRDIEKKVRAGEEMKPQYKTLIKLARTGKLGGRAGVPQQIAKMMGMENVALTTPQQIAQKLISNLNVERMFGLGVKGRATSKLLEEIGKTNPSLLNSPEAIEKLGRLNLNGIKQQEVLAKSIEKVRRQSGGGALPLGALRKAQEIAKPKLKELQKEAVKLAGYFESPDMKKSRTLTEFPNPKQVKRFRDSSTGIIYESNGSTFIPVGR